MPSRGALASTASDGKTRLHVAALWRKGAVRWLLAATPALATTPDRSWATAVHVAAEQSIAAEPSAEQGVQQ